VGQERKFGRPLHNPAPTLLMFSIADDGWSRNSGQCRSKKSRGNENGFQESVVYCGGCTVGSCIVVDARIARHRYHAQGDAATSQVISGTIRQNHLRSRRTGIWHWRAIPGWPVPRKACTGAGRSGTHFGEPLALSGWSHRVLWRLPGRLCRHGAQKFRCRHEI